MPWNPAQHRLFEAAARSPAIARRKGIAVTDARRMASEGIKRSRGGLAMYADGGPTEEVPSYQLPQNSPMPGVQLLNWNQLDPFTPAATYASTQGLRRGGPVRLAEGGDPSNAPSAYARALNFLSTQRGSGGGSSGGTRPPPIGGGRSIAAIGSDVDPGYGGTHADPKIDMRSAALEAINRRFKMEGDLSTAEAEVPAIMSSRMGSPTLASYAPPNMGALNPYRRSQLPLDVQLMTRPQQFADGGEVESGGGGDLAMLGAGLAASRLRPRHLNRLARPVMRAMSKPLLAVEAVSDKPLSRGQSDARFSFARNMAADSHALRFGDDSFRDLPVKRGQGAWQGEKGMEFNPLYMSELPRSLRRVRDQENNLRYASQIGENLEQAATPVSRFVPHLLNTADDSNALMVHGIDDAKLRRLAEILGPDIVTAHQPRNRALVFPTDDREMGGIADEINAGFGFPKIRYGRSDLDKDRVLLARKPLGYESALYSDFDALPRNRGYGQAEDQAVATKGWRPRLSFTGAK